MPVRALLATAAGAAIAFGVSGCGPGAGEPGGRAAAGSRAPTSCRTLAVVLVEGARADAVRVARGARAEAKRLDVALTIRGSATGAPGAQIRIVDAVTAAKPAAVLISPTDRGALAAPIASMRQAGITVIELAGPGVRRRGAMLARGGIDAVRRAVSARGC